MITAENLLEKILTNGECAT